MRKTLLQWLGVFLSINLCQVGFGQTSYNAVRLNSGANVSNTIFWRNTLLQPISDGVSVKHSALDSTMAGLGNIRLLSNPFVNEYRINSSSPAYNAGITADLRVQDTLDLDYANRVTCAGIDIGAFEYQVIPTSILIEPANVRTCVETPTSLSVTAEGTHITYQWVKNGEHLIGKTGSTLSLAGDLSDTGTYKVIVYGDCCNDTSVDVRVTVDLNPETLLDVMNDTTIDVNSNVELKAYVNSVVWYESDFTTEVVNLLIEDITETRQYVATLRNGVCPNQAVATVNIKVLGSSCVLVTRADTAICEGDSLQLVMNKAFVDYKWYNLQTGEELPKFARVNPDSTSRYVAKGENEVGHRCSDTLTVSIRKVTLVGMEDLAVCGQPGGTPVSLTSSPPADDWYDADGNRIGSGDISNWYVQNNSTNYFTAKRSDDMCVASVQVRVYSNPPSLKVSFKDTTICIGQSVTLSTNVEPRFIVWRRIGDNSDVSDALHENPIVRPDSSTTYRAWAYDSICGEVYDEVTVIVQQKPSFEIVSVPVICENADISLFSEPNASYWTALDGTRLVFPFTPWISHGMALEDWSDTVVAWYTSGACTVTDTVALSMEALLGDFVVCSDTCVFPDRDVLLWSEPLMTYWMDVTNDSLIGTGNCSVTITNATTYRAEYQTTCNSFSKVVNVSVFTDTFFVTPVTNSDCYEDGRAYCDIYGVTGPYIFQWSNGSTADTATGLLPGNYTVTVTDANSKAVVASFTITEGAQIHVTSQVTEAKNGDCNDGQIAVNVTGGNSDDYYYTWSDGTEGFNLSSRANAEAGIHMLTVTDSKGCTQKANVILPCLHKQLMPTLFITPNGDGKNDFLQIKYIERYPVNTVIIINSYGEEVNRLKNYDNISDGHKWNGRNKKGEILPDGVYYYIVEAEGVAPMVNWLLMKLSKSK